MTSSSSPNHSSLVQSVKRPVCLAISHNGVQFIDIESQGMICEHSVKNIDCACKLAAVPKNIFGTVFNDNFSPTNLGQDAEDLSHFAYITKDSENNMNYCHVFNVDSMVSLLRHFFSQQNADRFVKL